MLSTQPTRADLIAASTAVLAVFVTLTCIRFGDRWSDAALVLFSAGGAAAAAALALRSPRTGETPSPDQSVLYFATWALTLTALIVFALTVGDGGGGDGEGPNPERTVALLAAIMMGIAGFFAIDRGSPVCSFLAAISFGTAVIATLLWLTDAELQAVRWFLTLLIAGYVAVVVQWREERPAHAAQVANAAGIGALAIALPTLYLLFFGFGYYEEDFPFKTGWGWQLVVLIVGAALVSYGAIDRERGPRGVGIAVLVAFVALVSYSFSEDSVDFVGWPLALGLIAAAGFAAALTRSAD